MPDVPPDFYEVRDALLEEYAVVLDPEDGGEPPDLTYANDHREIIARIAGNEDFALAVIWRSKPHFHLRTREKYLVLKGKLTLIRAGVVTLYEAGDRCVVTIAPGEVHNVVGIDGPAWVKVWSSPRWDPDDHYEA